MFGREKKEVGTSGKEEIGEYWEGEALKRQSRVWMTNARVKWLRKE